MWLRRVFRARGVTMVVCAGLALLQAACNSLDATYIRDGIGTNLSPTDIIEITKAQELYVGEVCRQAGLSTTQQGDDIYCNEVNLRPIEWATFVQAGMN